jgi:hypothetical protein
VHDLLDELSDFEREVYEFIKERVEVQTNNMPSRMMGALPKLRNKGLVKLFKRNTSLWSSKKKKFVAVKTNKIK